MIKVCFFPGQPDSPAVIPLFGPADSVFEKLAAPKLLPSVAKYIAELRPKDDAQYVLNTAMGAGEFYSSNANGDHFEEEGLIHRPDNWKGIPEVDKIIAASWAYGFPTFYRAKTYMHHRNKDPVKSVGDVELVEWNAHMKRVELVTRLDKSRCLEHGGQGVWDRLKMGEYPSLSMGAKVPFDLCSICLDTKSYLDAVSSFEVGKHKSPGEAVLAYHKKKAIRGLSITRKDYCKECLTEMNRIYPDGRKVYVRNPYPNFFDISYVFIGADKIARSMLKIAEGGRSYWIPKINQSQPGNDSHPILEKVAASKESAQNKKSEISKNVVPSQFASHVVPLLEAREKGIPDGDMRLLSGLPKPVVIATLTRIGIILSPEEFDRIPNRSGSAVKSSGSFSEPLADLLSHLMPGRSALAPHIERRALFIGADKDEGSTSHRPKKLRKISSAYKSYREELSGLFSGLARMNEQSEGKLASGCQITPLSLAYAQHIFSPYHSVTVGDTDESMVNILHGDVRRRAEG